MLSVSLDALVKQCNCEFQALAGSLLTNLKLKLIFGSKKLKQEKQKPWLTFKISARPVSQFICLLLAGSREHRTPSRDSLKFFFSSFTLDLYNGFDL